MHSGRKFIESRYFRQIVKWTFIGLSLRLALMPFTMHGQDLTFINYFPMMFVREGAWDPYGFIKMNFPYFSATYYGPVLFFIMSAANFIFIKLFNASSLIALLNVSGGMMGRHFTTVDYVSAFSGLNLFGNLFLMKSPYLVFDFLIGAILLKSATSKESALAGYRLWILNIVVLHSVYMVGGAYLITAFFIIAALYAARQKRPYVAIILLSLGGATKLFPYFLILPTSLLLGDDWRKRLSLLLAAGAVTVCVYLPFYLSSGSSVFGFFAASQNVQYPGAGRWALWGIFLALYALISINAIKDSRSSGAGSMAVYYFMTVLFMSYAAFPVRFRYFVFVTPVLALVLPEHRKFGMFSCFIILMLAFQWLNLRDLQLGLFAPVNPGYFLSLPTLQEIAGRFINIEMMYKLTARALPVTFLVAARWSWRIGVGQRRRGAE